MYAPLPGQSSSRDGALGRRGGGDVEDDVMYETVKREKNHVHKFRCYVVDHLKDPWENLLSFSSSSVIGH